MWSTCFSAAKKSLAIVKRKKKNLGNNALNKLWQHAVSKSFSCEKFDHLPLPALLPKEEKFGGRLQRKLN